MQAEDFRQGNGYYNANYTWRSVANKMWNDKIIQDEVIDVQKELLHRVRHEAQIGGHPRCYDACENIIVITEDYTSSEE